ncbi:hypothetical protein Aperf_G00000125097 [Anoplocephala perfoliata]
MPRCCLVEVDNSSLHDRFSSLYAHISKCYNLPQDRMILLRDGGSQMKEFHQIKGHDAGENRDNPIYVFVRENAISPEPCSLEIHRVFGEELNFAHLQSPKMTYDRLHSHFKIIDSALLADMETVQQLGQDQHFMCHGWFVAQANFERDLEGFRENAKNHWEEYEAYCNEVGRWEANFNKFPAIKERLKSVPLLQSLLPTSSELTSDAIDLYGSPRTLYDWICHQTLHITPHLTGPVGSGFHLPSVGNSSLNIPTVPLNILRRHTSRLAVNASFYLSTSSPSQGGSGDGSMPAVVPSLESTLVELVENSSAMLKWLNDHHRRSDDKHKPSVVDDSDNNSLLMMGDELDDRQEEAKLMSVSTGPKLANLYSKLKDFDELLCFAPRDTDELSSAEVVENGEVDGFVSMIQGRKFGAPSSQSIPIGGSGASPFSEGCNADSLSFITSTSRHPIAEEESEQDQGKDSVSKSQDTVVGWRCSKRSFSRHLDNLRTLLENARDKVSQVRDLMAKVLRELKNRKSYKELDCHLDDISELLKKIGSLFQSIIQAKCDLADDISRLQEQLQNFSSEAMNKDRECVKYFTYLRDISKCSALLNQLQNSPELYVKCLLEIIRRRRLSTLWNSLNEHYTHCYAEFQRNESQRRESLALELKNHLLADVFRSLRSGHSARQASRVSLISIASTKQLNTENKCLSASQLNAPTSSAFRLPTIRQMAPPPSANESLIDRTEGSFVHVNETEVRELAAQLPPDLASMITEALEELDAEEHKLVTGIGPKGSGNDENGSGLTPSSGSLRLHWERQRRCGLSSSSGSRQSRQRQVVDASTNTVSGGPLATENKEVEANFDFRDDVCLPPPLKRFTPPSESVDQSSDLYLSIEASHFTDIQQISSPAVSSLNFFSPQGSHGDVTLDRDAASSGSESIVAPSDSRLLNEALASQSEGLTRLVEQLNSCLPSNLSVMLHGFTPGEETAYLNETVSCVNQLISHLEAHKLVLVASISSTSSSTSSYSPSKVSTSSVSTQTNANTCDQSTECPARHSPAPQALSTSVGEGSSALSGDLLTRIPRHNFVFSAFRPEDLVIFIPIVGAEKHQSESTSDVPVGQDALAGSGGIAFWGARSLALLSSAIISSSLAPSSPQIQTDNGTSSSSSGVEQWRMLSNDGHVYFLHDDDFAAFNLARLACQPATSAPGRAGELSQSGSTSETVLPLARRAEPFVIGVFQRKEKCISRKDENRFGLPRDFVFFRVRARPL